MKSLTSISKSLPVELKFGITNLYIYTENGLGMIDRLAEYNFWDRWNDIGIVTMVASMVGFMAFLVISSITILITDPPASSGTEPANLVAIPGLNDYIPFEHFGVFVLALFVALLVHEGGHAIAMRRAGVDIEEWGVIFFLGVIPLGAYVEPDEEQLESQPLRDYSRILSAGIMNNYVLTILTAAYFIFLPSTPSLIGVFVQHFGILAGESAFFELSFITTLVYWQLFIHLNLGLVNTLPIFALDGGRVFSKTVENRVDADTKYKIPALGEATKLRVLKVSATVTSIFLFSILAFGPYF